MRKGRAKARLSLGSFSTCRAPSPPAPLSCCAPCCVQSAIITHASQLLRSSLTKAKQYGQVRVGRLKTGLLLCCMSINQQKSSFEGHKGPHVHLV